MSLFTEKERADLCYMHDNNPGALFDATVAAVLEKLTAGVSVEPVAWLAEYGGDVYTATAIAAARVQENERCARTLEAIGCQGYADALRALLGKEQL